LRWRFEGHYFALKTHVRLTSAGLGVRCVDSVYTVVCRWKWSQTSASTCCETWSYTPSIRTSFSVSPTLSSQNTSPTTRSASSLAIRANTGLTGWAFEYVDKIQRFLANVNCIQQEVVW